MLRCKYQELDESWRIEEIWMKLRWRLVCDSTTNIRGRYIYLMLYQAPSLTK